MKRLLMVSGIAGLAAVGGCACGTNRCGDRVQTERVSRAPVYYADADTSYNDPSMVGPRGPDGPAGPAGERGVSGERGAAGYAVAGPRGGAGPEGLTGDQGHMGATGPAGPVVRGRAGPQGPAGDVGGQGPRGATGARGESASGIAGRSGPQGPTGPEGPSGPRGPRGEALEGPTGPAGRTGPAGAQGAYGSAGEQGSTTAGIAGPAGPAGPRGQRGAPGEPGDQGRVGVVAGWTPYREFWFQGNDIVMYEEDRQTASEIATYVNKNPSLVVAIDASPRLGSDSRSQTICDQRARAVSELLVKAGVSSDRIRFGEFGDPDLRRDRRVEVLIATAN